MNSNSFAQAKATSYSDLTPRQYQAHLNRGCEKGTLANCYELGLIYSGFESQGAKNHGKSLIQKACNGGHKNACVNLKGGILAEAKSSDILFYASILLMGLAAFLIFKQVFEDESEFKAKEQLDDSEQSKEKEPNHGIVLKYSRPFFKRYVSPIVGTMKSKNKIKEKYKRKLASAGLTEYLTTDDFYAFKLFLIVGFPIVFIAVRTFLEETWPLTMIPVLGAVGFVYPDIWIKGKIEQRQKDIILAMPFCVDMLALSVEAGMDFVAAMTKVIEKAKPSPLVKEFEILIKENKIGASRAEALRNLAWRVDLIQISSFCATLIAADSVGASIGPILKNLSVEIRQKRSADAEKAGATAATKIIFPMLLLITPAVFIVIAAPLVIEAMAGGK